MSAWLTRHALLGPLLAGKTVLAVTHSPELLAAAAVVVRVERGGKVRAWAGRGRSNAGAAVWRFLPSPVPASCQPGRATDPSSLLRLPSK